MTPGPNSRGGGPDFWKEPAATRSGGGLTATSTVGSAVPGVPALRRDPVGAELAADRRLQVAQDAGGPVKDPSSRDAEPVKWLRLRQF